jgi:hypothetical protein
MFQKQIEIRHDEENLVILVECHKSATYLDYEYRCISIQVAYHG